MTLSTYDVVDTAGAESGAVAAAPQNRTERTLAQPKFYGIQAGRGIAAFFVILTHTSLIMSEPRFYGEEPFHGIFRGFGAGVDFFFVLSGFIIAWMHWRDIGNPAALARYFKNRLIRIYPPYWCILIPLAALYFIFPNAGAPRQHDPVNFLFSLVLAPYPEQPILGAAWTLVHEMLFYIVFGCIILVGRYQATILALWGGAILLLQLFPQASAFPWSILLSAYNIEFLLGVAAAVWMSRKSCPLPGVSIAVGTIVFLSFMVFGEKLTDEFLVARVVFGCSSVLVVVGLVECERNGRLKVGRGLALLGAASYSIYLVHGPALSALIQIMNMAFGRMVPVYLAVIALACGSVAAGLVFYAVCERPLLVSLRRLTSSPRDRRDRISKPAT
jgi:peptidoglycan/LPS O-acetylase OafA/YrhL